MSRPYKCSPLLLSLVVSSHTPTEHSLLLSPIMSTTATSNGSMTSQVLRARAIKSLQAADEKLGTSSTVLEKEGIDSRYIVIAQLSGMIANTQFVVVHRHQFQMTRPLPYDPYQPPANKYEQDVACSIQSIMSRECLISTPKVTTITSAASLRSFGLDCL